MLVEIIMKAMLDVHDVLVESNVHDEVLVERAMVYLLLPITPTE